MQKISESPSYSGLLALPGAPRAVAAATLGRLAYGMLSLALLILVQQATHSFAIAGAAIGSYSIGTLSGPLKARVIDRRGQRVVLPLLGAGYSALLFSMVALAFVPVRQSFGYLTLSFAAGAIAPPLGPAMRKLWAGLTGGGSAQEKAYVLDVGLEEILYTVGPVLVGVALTFGGPNLPLMLVGVFLFAGTVLMATSRAVELHAAPTGLQHSGSRLGPLRNSGFPALLIITLLTAMGTSAVDVTVTARAVHEHNSGAAGYVLAALAVGSAIGGLAWGHFKHSRRPSTQVATLVTFTSIGVLGAAFATNLLILAAVLLVTGLSLTPALVINYITAEKISASANNTEATTWINTASNGGLALGASLAGVVIDSFGTGTPMIIGACLLLATAGWILKARDVYDRVSKNLDGLEVDGLSSNLEEDRQG